MSSLSRAALGLQPIDVLICATLIIASGACARAPSVEPRPIVGTPSELRQSNAQQQLPGHFPGVDLVPLNHEAFAIRIHSRMVGDGPPLYVIDGRPTMVEPIRGIDWLRPEDISRISVLKNPADLAIYGPRGVNGVVVITTKHGANPR
jgi:TonB-dependent SusC/RagA subfamily outer membrane receptor